MTVILFEEFLEGLGISQVRGRCLWLLYFSKYILLLFFLLDDLDFFFYLFLPLTDLLLPLVVIKSGDPSQVDHRQRLKHVRVGDKLPFLKEHPRFVSRAEGESESLVLTWLKYSMRVVAVEALHTIGVFAWDEIPTVDLAPVIGDCGGAHILKDDFRGYNKFSYLSLG
jgi:hypothetical protein